MRNNLFLLNHQFYFSKVKFMPVICFIGIQETKNQIIHIFNPPWVFALKFQISPNITIG